MAKQGYWKFEKTIQGLVFYRLYDGWYIRRVSSLSGRRVKTSKKFIKSMICANRLGVASAMASAVYDRLPDGWKLFELYQQLVGIGVRMLKVYDTDQPLENILLAMEQQLSDWGYRKDIKYERVKPSAVPVRISHYRLKRNRKVIVRAEKVPKEKAKPVKTRLRSIAVPHYEYNTKKQKLVLLRKEVIAKIRVPRPTLSMTEETSPSQFIKPPGLILPSP